MSVKLVVKVWNEAQIAGRPLTTLLALAFLANQEGEVGVTFEDLRQRCRLNATQLYGCLEQLLMTQHMESKGLDAEQGRLFFRLFPEKRWQLQRQ